MNEITIGEKIYVSSKRAAEITGYAKDYIGQLCREGRVEARLIGRNWYLLDESIRKHRFGGQDLVVKSEETAATDGIPEVDALWESPRYESEEPKSLEMGAETAYDAEKAQNSPQTSGEFLNDMQSAWNEWFASKAVLEETPVTAEMGENAESASHILPAIEPNKQNDARVPEQTSATEEVPLKILQEYSHQRQKSEVNNTNPEQAKKTHPHPYPVQASGYSAMLGMRIALIVVALGAISTAVFGTGLIKIPLSVLNEAAVARYVTGSNILVK